MNVASRGLSQKLSQISDWKDTDFDWCWDSTEQVLTPNDGSIREFPHHSCAAYDLGYLLRKLPKSFDGYFFDLSVTENGWVAEYFTNDYTPERPIGMYSCQADTPEDCLVKLAIELIESGVLPRGGDAD